MIEMTLKERLAALGWGEEFLDATGSFARLGVGNSGAGMEACFEPFTKGMRASSSKTLPLREVFASDIRLKFSRSLLQEKYGDGDGWTNRAVRLWDWVSRSKGALANAPVFEGFVESATNQKQFADFPFDQYLVIEWRWDLRLGSRIYVEPDGTRWRVADAALCHVKRLTISF